MSATATDMRPLGLGICAWAAMWLASSGQPSLLWAGAIGAACLAVGAGVRRSWYLGGLALVVASCLAVGGARVWANELSPLRQGAHAQAMGVVEVTVDGGGRLRDAKATRGAWWVGGGHVVGFESRGTAWAGGGPVTIMATGAAAAAWAGIPMGSTVRATVRLQVPDADAPVVAIARTRAPPEVIRRPDPVSAAVGAVRQGLRDASAPLSPQVRGLVPALVVGDVAGISDDLQEQFKITALTHLMAVSGSNLVLLLVTVRAVAVGLGARGRVLTAVMLSGIVAFVLVCLGEPSVLRAAGMGLIGMAALGHGGGPSQGRRFLAGAVWLLVLIDPWLARSWGFALSVVASAGLLWWARSWTDALATWLPRWLAEAVAVPLAAQVATEPIVVALAGRVSPVGLLANAVAAPLVGPATTLGFAAALASVVWLPVGELAARAAGVFAEGIVRVAILGAELPSGAVSWPTTPLAIALVAVACAALALLAPRVLTRRWLMVAVGTCWVVVLLRAPAPPGWPPVEWSVASCDVGQGDATVVNAGDGQGIVIDGGPDRRLLERCLSQLGIRRVPLVFATHLHADHVSGLAAVSTRGPEAVVTSGVESPASGVRSVRSLPGSQRIAVPGQVWTVGTARIDVLAVPEPPTRIMANEVESSGENDASLLLRITNRSVTTLVVGDAEEAGQGRHVALGRALDVDVLLVPHHGSARQSPTFLELTSPKVALVSVGAGNDYGHPTERTLGRLRGLGAHIVRTDESGTIAVGRTPDGRLAVTTQR